MNNHKLIFIDIETTGLDFTQNEIIEIGAVLIFLFIKLLSSQKYHTNSKYANIKTQWLNHWVYG